MAANAERLRRRRRRPQGALSFAAPRDLRRLRPGYLIATKSVAFLANVPLDADTAGARLLGKTF